MVTDISNKTTDDFKSEWFEYLSSYGDDVRSRCSESFDHFPYVMRFWPKNPYFFPIDFTRSHTALRLGIPNIPDVDSWNNIVTLVTEYLIPLREKIKQPIIISSGFRCPALNSAVNGAKHSYHMQGRACDIMCNNNLTLYNALSRLAIFYRKSHKPVLTELIQYTNFIHFAI